MIAETSSTAPQRGPSLFGSSVFQGGNGVDDESEKLLSALSQMLDTVEDEDASLSPFDSLPDTELLEHPKASGGSEVG